MNAINHTETQALDTATLEVAAPAQNLIVVPLSQLRASKRNVRKTAGQSIDALAESIARVGLLQNLTVILARDGEHYEVVAGGRRLAALKLLSKTRRIPKDWEVPCLLVADANARTVSLTENVQREAMHPADQFEAFAALVAEGRPIEDIAADFSVTPLVVQRRLKLANVSQRLLADYRADAVNLDQLMALAITDDHAAQDAAFYDAPEWQRGPHALRDRLTEREIDADHALVRFVGLDAYEAAGGGIRRDLFAQDDRGVYVTDAALLETLVREKLDGHAAEVKAEGWAWVDAAPAASLQPVRQRAGRLVSHQTVPTFVRLAAPSAGSGHHRPGQASRRCVGAGRAARLSDGLYRSDHHLAIEQGRAKPGRDPKEVVAAYVRRLEALRRAGIVERVAEGLWKVPNDLPERGRRYDAQRLGGVAVKLKSHLSIGRQARVIGPTWLDQQLIGGGKGLGDLGFGGEAKLALQRRADFLEEQGLAQRRGQRVILVRNLLGTLRDRELTQAAKDIAADIGLEHRPVADGQRVAGIYRRSVMLASGRYAMLDDGMGFSLVPWKPVIEKKLGQQIAVTVRGGSVSWEMGRQRSLVV